MYFRLFWIKRAIYNNVMVVKRFLHCTAIIHLLVEGGRGERLFYVRKSAWLVPDCVEWIRLQPFVLERSFEHQIIDLTTSFFQTRNRTRPIFENRRLQISVCSSSATYLSRETGLTAPPTDPATSAKDKVLHRDMSPHHMSSMAQLRSAPKPVPDPQHSSTELAYLQ